MKVIFLIATYLIVFSGISSGQTGKQRFLKQIGLSVILPDDFNELSQAASDSINNKGKKAIESTYNEKADFSATKTLISVRKSRFDFFNCTITPFDSKKDGSWAEMNKNIKDVLYNTFATQMKGAKIDTSSIAVKIDGIKFDKFQTVITFDTEHKLNCYLYSTPYKGYDVGITCVFMDQQTGKELQLLIDNAKFTR